MFALQSLLSFAFQTKPYGFFCLFPVNRADHLRVLPRSRLRVPFLETEQTNRFPESPGFEEYVAPGKILIRSFLANACVAR